MNNTTQEMIKMNKSFYTIQDIADAYNITKQAVSQRFQRAGYERLKFPYVGRDQQVLTCKSMFEDVVKKHVHIKDIADELGVHFCTIKAWMKFHDVKGEFCYKGKHSAAWKNGRTKDAKGYIVVNCFDIGYDKFNPGWKSHIVSEHKSNFEMNVLDEPILNGYVIHHLDLSVDNNELSNLTLLTRGQHSYVHRKLEGGMDNRDVSSYAIACSRANVIFHSLQNISKEELVAVEGKPEPGLSDEVVFSDELDTTGLETTQENHPSCSVLGTEDEQ